MTSTALIVVDWCDFPNCSNGCWTRCKSVQPCWDGRQAGWQRAAWVAWRANRPAKVKRTRRRKVMWKPMQQIELFSTSGES